MKAATQRDLSLGTIEQPIPGNPEPKSLEAKLLKAEILRRFVDVTIDPNAETWKVMKTCSRMGEIGRAVAVIGLKHSSGYEIVIRFADGKMESFTAMDLYPDPARVAAHAQESDEGEDEADQ